MATSIWEEESHEFKLQSLTDDMVTSAEEMFGITFPDAYLAILKEQNGGRILYNAFPHSMAPVQDDAFIPVDHIKGIGLQNGILDNAYFLNEWDMLEGLILFSGDGHTWLAMDYRNIVSNPPIVYVDNEAEQITQVAGSFDEFLTKLSLEQSDASEEDGDAVEEYSEQDLERFIQQNKCDELVMALVHLSYTDVDVKWFGERLQELSVHLNEVVRIEVVRIIWGMTHQLEDPTLNRLLAHFEKDPESDVQLFADLIKEKMNYPFEKLREDVELTGMESFSYQGEIYHVNEHSNLWHLSDYQTDFQSYPTVGDLLENATINGKLLKEIWSQVKKV